MTKRFTLHRFWILYEFKMDLLLVYTSRLFSIALFCPLGSTWYPENFGGARCRHSSYKLPWGTGKGSCVSLFKNGLCWLSFLGWWGRESFKYQGTVFKWFQVTQCSNIYCILLRGQTELAVIYHNGSRNPSRSRETSWETEQGGQGNFTIINSLLVLVLLVIVIVVVVLLLLT